MAILITLGAQPCLLYTSQVFEKAVYQRAMKKAEQEGADYTDDCQLVEQLGVGVHPVSYTHLFGEIPF